MFDRRHPITTSVELARTNKADLHCKFYRRHRTTKLPIPYKILSVSVRKWNSTMSIDKYQSGLFNDQCPLLFFLFNPRIIFGRCLLGNVRSASSSDSCFLVLDRSSFLTNIDYHFFINIGEESFLVEVGQCFSSRVNEYMPVSAETQLRLSSHEKTKPTYIVSFIGDNEQQNFLYRKKYYRPAFGNEIPKCR